jgi:diadenosine tetraphosphate (Ap4A) HIT family hydrolase
MSYDPQNVFAKILDGKIPAKKLDENPHALAFEDIHPLAPVHALVIPKGAYENLIDFVERGSDAELADLVRLMADVAKAKGVDRSGFRIIANNGPDGHQEVPHLHFHILGGRRMGPMVKRPSDGSL